MKGLHPKSEAALIAHALHTGAERGRVYVQPNGKAYLVYDEPTCIGCGCTHSTPCPGGCAWAKLERKGTNRGLCTACKDRGVKFTHASSNGKEMKTTAKKAKKKASKSKPASKKNGTTAPAAG